MYLHPHGALFAGPLNSNSKATKYQNRWNIISGETQCSNNLRSPQVLSPQLTWTIFAELFLQQVRRKALFRKKKRKEKKL